MSVAILGGGISGLVAARALREKGIEFDVFEAQDHPGGLCRSDTVDGYVMARAGGHIVFSKHQRAMDYYHALYPDEPLVKTERHTRILFKGGGSSSRGNDDEELYVINADGTGDLVNLTNEPGRDCCAHWQLVPDIR